MRLGYNGLSEGGVEGDGEIFTPHAGLCHNLIQATHWKIQVTIRRTEMKSQFVAATLDRRYPFGGERIYDIAKRRYYARERRPYPLGARPPE